MRRHWYTNWSRHQDERIIRKRLLNLEATWPHFWDPIYDNFKARRHLHGLVKTPIQTHHHTRKDNLAYYRFKRAKHERNARQWQIFGWGLVA